MEAHFARLTGNIVSKNGSTGPYSEVEVLDWFELYRPAPSTSLELSALERELVSAALETTKPGARVGIAVGSRGIARLPEVVEALVRALRGCGTSPVLIPAMGSHGGASESGQVAVLHKLGVRPDALGVPVDASMEVEEVGRLASGLPVFVSRAALCCDALVPVNRVKPHTAFRAPVESGLTKMLTIGLGKERGASSLHRAGFESFGTELPEAAQIVCSMLNVPFGVALLEDQWHRLCRAEVVRGEEIFQRDQALLREAWELFARLPFEQVDVLVLKEMGKTISGAGMDPNVTGRFSGSPLPSPTAVGRLVVLDLREDSGGNATGVGMADIVTERLRTKIDWAATYANARTSKSLASARLPIVVATDIEALSWSMASLVGCVPTDARVAAIINTLEVGRIVVSEPLVASASAAGYVPRGGPVRAVFSEAGDIERIGGLEFFRDPDVRSAVAS